MQNSIKSSTTEPAYEGHVFAADLGGTHLRAATIDRNGKIIYRLRQRTPTAERPEDIVGALVSAARECQAQSTGARDHILSLSIVVPGSVNVKAGMVVKAPNLPCLDGFHLTNALSEAMQRPAILENDANAAAVGEMWQGAARGRRSLICVTLGTGVGGGIILDGRLWRG